MQGKPAPSPGYPQDPDPDPDPHEDFCPDPDPQKKCGSETLTMIVLIILDYFFHGILINQKSVVKT